MRRFCTFRPGVLLVLLLGVVAALVPWSSAHGAPAQAQTITVALTDTKVVTFDQPASHVAVYWQGNPSARVTLAYSTDGVAFDRPVDAGRDDAGQELDDGMTYGAVHAADGVVAVRVTTNAPLSRLSVVAMPSEGSRAFRAIQAAEFGFEYEQPTVIPRAVWGADPLYLSWAPRFYPASKVIVHHTSDNIRPTGRRSTTRRWFERSTTITRLPRTGATSPTIS